MMRPQRPLKLCGILRQVIISFVLLKILFRPQMLGRAGSLLVQALPSLTKREVNGLTVTDCSNCLELGIAMADPSVQLAFILTDITLSASDFAAVGAPIYLNRNLTILGAYELKEQWPVLEMGFMRGQVTLAPGVTLNFSRLVVNHVQKAPHFQAPGMDLLTFVPRNESVPISFLVVWNSGYIQRTCLPDSLSQASSDSIKRSRELPGRQLAGRLPQWQPCSTDPTAQPMTQCWLRLGVYDDIAVYAYGLLNRNAVPAQANYILWTYKVYYMCNTVMADPCIARSGLLGCYYEMFQWDEDNQTAVQPITISPAPNRLQAPAQQLLPGPSSQLPSSSQTSQHGHTQAVASWLGGLIGGIVVLVAIVVVLVVYVRHRQRKLMMRKNEEYCAGPLGRQTLDSSRADISLGNINKDALSRSRSSYRGNSPRLCPSQPNSILVQHLSNLEEMAGANRLCVGTTTQEGPLPTLTGIPDASERNHNQLDVGIMDLVTTQTPKQDVKLGLDMQHGEVQLTSVVLGKGSFGRVVKGMYGSLPVAVKLLNTGLIDQAGGGGGADAGAGGYPSKKEMEKGDRKPMVGVAMTTASPGMDTGHKKEDYSTRSSASLRTNQATTWQQHEKQQQQQQQDEEERTATEDTDKARSCLAALSQEVEVLARCRHPNIVRLLAANLEPPHVCLVMELMETSLEKLLYGGGIFSQVLPLMTVLQIGMQIANALSYLHPTILHRDLKPANVLISEPQSGKPIVKLADFGLSRLRDTVLVTKNPEVGTAPYMAPETFDLENTIVTDRVDIFALGVILWEMVACRRPWDGQNAVQIAFNLVLRDIRLPMDVISEDRCPPKLRSLIEICWDADPARRPAAAEVAKSLVLLIQQDALVQRMGASAVAASAAPAGTTNK